MIVSELQDNVSKEKLIRRQIDWCNVLRLQLRQTTDYWNAERFPSEVELMDRFKLLGEPKLDFNKYLNEKASKNTT
ncbi:hypothetical protein BH11CYA1_BH11CYA1_15960 [soil metagenome]